MKGIVLVSLVGLLIPAVHGPCWATGEGDMIIYRNYKLGYIHGAQYWVNPGATPESIENDFRLMAEEDYINCARLAFWGMSVGNPIDFTLWDVCFASAARHGIMLNPVLPQIPGWIDGGGDDPKVRLAYGEHITSIVKRYKDESALAMWTVDIEPSRSWRADPSEITLALYRDWLGEQYVSVEEFREKNPGLESFENASCVNSPRKGQWNNFQSFIDWTTFTAWKLAEQVKFVSDIVKEADPLHPTSATPPDILQNQTSNGRNMWWLADVVDYPGSQMHAHYHLETADMPEDVLAAQAATVRKLFCSGRGRPAYTGEMLAGQDLGEGNRLYSPSPEELMASTVVHLAEGSKGYFYWLWNPLMAGPNAGCWTFRSIDGTPSYRSRLLANFGKMVREHNDLLYRMRPADTHVAILDLGDAAAYLRRRSQRHDMYVWFAQNQYGFFKALRENQMGCDFVDEVGMRNGTLEKYPCVYVPFSMCLTEEKGRILREYVAKGGTIVVDAMTAYTRPHNMPYKQQPGAGLSEVLGLKARTMEIANKTQDIFNVNGDSTPLAAVRIVHPVDPTTAEVTHTDRRGRPVCTVSRFGKGHAIWTGTLLGLSCWANDTPDSRYEAVGDMIREYVPETPWKLESSSGTIICRRLSDGEEDIFVLINEGDEAADFKLSFGQQFEPRELLWPGKTDWKEVSESEIAGTLDSLGSAVVHCVPQK